MDGAADELEAAADVAVFGPVNSRLAGRTDHETDVKRIAGALIDVAAHHGPPGPGQLKRSGRQLNCLGTPDVDVIRHAVESLRGGVEGLRRLPALGLDAVDHARARNNGQADKDGDETRHESLFSVRARGVSEGFSSTRT